jgi:hypothetical protein
VVEAWEELFFDVRGSRRATSWVLNKVILPEGRAGNSALAAKMKCAFAGGPALARAILDVEAAAPVQEGANLFERRLQVELKFTEALEALLVTERGRLAFTKIYLEMKQREQRLELERRWLEQRAEKAVRQQRADESRRQAAAERTRQRGAQAAQREARRRHREEVSRLRQEARAEARARRAAAGLEWAATSQLAQLRWGRSGPRVPALEPLSPFAEGADYPPTAAAGGFAASAAAARPLADPRRAEEEAVCEACAA